MLFAARIPLDKLIENVGFWPGIGIAVAICGVIFLWRYFGGDDD